jgi:hypothetical protein
VTSLILRRSQHQAHILGITITCYKENIKNHGKEETRERQINQYQQMG